MQTNKQKIGFFSQTAFTKGKAQKTILLLLSCVLRFNLILTDSVALTQIISPSFACRKSTKIFIIKQQLLAACCLEL